jgi:hypothetical protein
MCGCTKKNIFQKVTAKTQVAKNAVRTIWQETKKADYVYKINKKK